MATNFALADKLVDGGLAERLAQEMAAGRSFDSISQRLTAEGISVSRETVRRWCIDLGFDTSKQREATA